MTPDPQPLLAPPSFRAGPYGFQALRRRDLPMVARWLRTPEVSRWWGEPAQQLAVVAGDLDDPAMQQWVVSCGERPFAYAQAYRLKVWPQPHLSDLPPEARMIDAFIGEPPLLARGHGRAFLRALSQMLQAHGAPMVAIDPEAANLRARRAYAGAGFRVHAAVAAQQGPTVVMIYAP